MPFSGLEAIGTTLEAIVSAYEAIGIAIEVIVSVYEAIGIAIEAIVSVYEVIGIAIPITSIMVPIASYMVPITSAHNFRHCEGFSPEAISNEIQIASLSLAMTDFQFPSGPIFF